MPEAWLRGPIEGVPDELQPVAHSLVDALEDMERTASGLTAEQLWHRSGGVAPVGFHLRHAAGSLDRLLTYARGDGLSDEQFEALRREADPGNPPAEIHELLEGFREAIDAAIAILRATPPGSLDEPRAVGRSRLPSTVRGLLFHAAEHTRRHAGQVVATAGIIRGMELGEGGT